MFKYSRSTTLFGLKTLNCSEMGSEVGERVGYKVRFQEESGPNTQVR